MITGATGMIGSLILKHCLEDPEVSSVCSVVRRPGTLQHPKLKEIIPDDFLNYESFKEEFRNIDTAYFCLGVYTGTMSDEEFRTITVDYTLAFANALEKGSPEATFVFLSGNGADRDGKSRMSFARYKGRAEKHLLQCRFPHLFIFRPGYIYPVEKRKEPNTAYRIMRFLYPALQPLLGNNAIRSTELAAAMYRSGYDFPEKDTLENQDILNYLHGRN